jgi:hypothetical protein
MSELYTVGCGPPRSSDTVLANNSGRVHYWFEGKFVKAFNYIQSFLETAIGLLGRNRSGLYVCFNWHISSPQRAIICEK